eukprot:NODE_7_length_67686_cov_1.621421.p54 type:complete len:122 gc:universal NODE_7_length_67686_cov_1.621421:53822-53457(-)
MTGMDIELALQTVLRTALYHDGLARGLRECVKALDRRQAVLCVLSEECDSKEYAQLIEALCTEGQIRMVKYPEGKKLGEMAGLCKYDREGNARKVVRASCVVVKKWGAETEASQFIIDQFK